MLLTLASRDRYGCFKSGSLAIKLHGWGSVVQHALANALQVWGAEDGTGDSRGGRTDAEQGETRHRDGGCQGPREP